MIRISNKKQMISTATDIFLIILLLIIQSGIAGITWFNSPVRQISKIDELKLERYYVCNDEYNFNSQMVSYMFISVSVAIQALRAWKLPSFFNETKYIAFGTLTPSLCIVCMFPLYYSAPDVSSKSNIRALLLMLSNLCLMICLYANKIIILYFYPAQNTRAYFQKHATREVDENMVRSSNVADARKDEQEEHGV